LSRMRGRPVPAEMLPALSPQPSQQRTGRVSALVGSGIVVVVIGIYPLWPGPRSVLAGFSEAVSLSICMLPFHHHFTTLWVLFWYNIYGDGTTARR